MAESGKVERKVQMVEGDPPPFLLMPPLSFMKAPTAETTFFFKGFDVILEKYKDIDTDREINEGLKSLGAHLEFKPKPEQPPVMYFSPVSPEKAEEAAAKYVNLVDSTSIALFTALIAAEVAGLGQVDVTINNILRHPVVAAALENAAKVHGMTLAEGILPAYRYKILKDYQPLRADERVLVENFVRGIIDFETFLEQIEYLGYDTDEAVKMANAAFRYPDFDALLTMLRREIISDAWFRVLARRVGLHPAVIPFLESLRWQIPGYSDIIRIYMREGYQPEKWAEIPAEFIEWMKRLGYDEYWTLRLWGAHWVLPSIELLYEMFWKKIISYDELVQMLKYHDYEPVWRERLIQNAYRAIPRVDLRRAYRYGRLRAEELRERYEWLGFKPSDAQIMSDIAVRESLDRYYTRLETVARAAYRKGKLSREGLINILRQINTPEAAISLVLEAEDLAREAAVLEPAEEPRTLTVSQVLSLYRNRVTTREWTFNRLVGMGFSQEDAVLLIRLNEPKPEPIEVRKDLIEAASALYREGLMPLDEFMAYLRKAGLSEEEIQNKVEVENLRYRLDYAKDLIALVKEAYRKDVYTEDEALAFLLYHGMELERAKAILALESLRKMPKPRAD